MCVGGCGPWLWVLLAVLVCPGPVVSGWAWRAPIPTSPLPLTYPPHTPHTNINTHKPHSSKFEEISELDHLRITYHP